MSDVFISYSRKDGEFVHRLSTAFTNANRVVWVDWQDIPRGEDWWREIQTGIEQADAFICIVSEAWLTSEICHNELDYARQQNKRILPIIRQQIHDDAEKRIKGTWMDLPWEQTARENWDVVCHLNWIFLDQDAKFEAEFNSLLKTLEQDQPHIKAHTRYQNRALEWERSGQNPSFLLSGDDLTFAESWLAGSADKQPQPTIEHQAYIRTSRTATDTRKKREAARELLVFQFRRAAIVLGIVGVVALIATGFAVPISINAVNTNATSISQIQTATLALSTATQVAYQVVTATYAQGQAIFAQETSAAREQEASTQVAVAGATLSPVPPTLTAVASAIADAHEQQDIAIRIANASLRSVEGNTAEALRLVEALVEQYPDQALAYMGRGLILENAQQSEAAIADYTQAIQLDPQNPDIYYNRGLAYTRNGKLEEAIADYTQALQLNPALDRAFANRGSAYSAQGKLDEAITDYNQALTLDPQNAEVYINRGLTYSANNQLDEAIADFDQALVLNPQNPEVYVSRGAVYFQMGDVEQAITDFNQAILIDPQFANAYGARGLIYYFENRFAEALADWETFEQLGRTLPTEYQALRTEMQTTLTATPTN